VGGNKFPMTLRDYQEQISTDAAKLLEWVKIAYLSMQVRTGKTLTALAACEKYGAKVVLFVTTKKAISSIEQDYDSLNPSFIIDIINFEQLHNLVRTDYDVVIIDEAHRISQFPTSAERTKELKKICEGLPVIFLSGTPTPESYSQLYHQFFISSYSPFKEYRTFYAWAKDFVTVKKKYYFNKEINDYSFANKQKIDEYTKHLFISYTQEEAGFEQMVQEEVLKVQMSPATHGLAKKLLKDKIYIGSEGQELLADTAVKLQNKLHQIYSGTVICEDGNGICFDQSKATFIKEYFKGQKIAIFYKFKCEAVMLITVFGYDRLTDDPMEFNSTENKIFYSQVQSGREGINLSTADALVMLNIDFSSVSYQQARARIQSKERTKEAMLYWIFAEGGIEEKIYQRVINKQDYTLSYFRKDYQISEMREAI
jgi:superfamily II DNA or RNA helicase